MGIELPECAWVVLRSPSPDGGGELVSWHGAPAEAEMALDAVQREEPALNFVVEKVSRRYLEMFLSHPLR